MEDILFIIASIVGVLLLVWVIKVIINGPTNNPTWRGIIISAVLGLLPLYLFLCWMGWMGEEKSHFFSLIVYQTRYCGNC